MVQKKIINSVTVLCRAKYLNTYSIIFLLSASNMPRRCWWVIKEAVKDSIHTPEFADNLSLKASFCLSIVLPTDNTKSASTFAQPLEHCTLSSRTYKYHPLLSDHIIDIPFTFYFNMYSGYNPPPRPQYHSRTPEPRYGRQSYPQAQPGFQQPYGPPPGADPQLWQWFSNVDADRSGSITVTELQSALVNGALI